MTLTDEEHRRALILEILERHRKGIERAAEHALGQYTFDDVVDAVLAGQWNVLVISQGQSILVTERPSNRQLHIVIASGKLADICDGVRSLKGLATIGGYNRVTIAGRRGWLRALEAEGMKEVGVIASVAC